MIFPDKFIRKLPTKMDESLSLNGQLAKNLETLQKLFEKNRKNDSVFAVVNDIDVRMFLSSFIDFATRDREFEIFALYGTYLVNSKFTEKIEEKCSKDQGKAASLLKEIKELTFEYLDRKRRE